MKNVSYAAGSWSQGAVSQGSGLVEGLVATVRTAVAAFTALREARLMRHDLAQLDPSILRDLGVAPDEIARIRASEPFTSRAWTA